MRVLFVTAVLPSHYFVMAPFAWALRAAGHEVYVATQPELVETVARSGLPVVSVGREAAFAERYRRRQDGRPRSADPKVLFCDVAEGMADDLVPFARSWQPDAVVWEPSTFVGPLVAQLCGAVSLRCLWGPDIIERGIGRDKLPAEFADLFARFGVELEQVPPWRTIDVCPDDAQVIGDADRRIPARFVPYSSAGQVPEWATRRPEKPRVCVTLGITMTEVSGKNAFFAPQVLRALSELDVELVAAVVSEQRGMLGEVPEGVLVAEDCALYELVPHCDLVVHHGGVGSMLTAALNGVPQLTLTQMPDQTFYAANLLRCGASVHIPFAEAAPQTLRDTVRDLLDDPSYRKAAARVRDHIRSRPAPSECVPLIERLVADAGRLALQGAS